MIVGVILRYFKTYQGINYIPLTDHDKFCGLVGDNGVGKSSILEGLDCFFNDKQWNLNNTTKKSGTSTTRPQIVPIFLLKKDLFSPQEAVLAEKLNRIAREISEDDVNASVRHHIKRFIDNRKKLLTQSELGDFYLMPLGIDHNNQITISIFNCKKSSEIFDGSSNPAQETDAKSSISEIELNTLKPILETIKKTIDYLYIPKEIDPESFTKLESDSIQVLMGETLIQRLNDVIPAKEIGVINSNLTQIVDQISNELEIYSYRTPTDRQQNLKKIDVYNLIIESYFKIRKLHKKLDDNWLEISALSSGEKQKAIIDVANSLLCKHRENGENLIIAVDEPESSLHMSACFEQFDTLYNISRNCMQLIFTSHWYGFLPTIESGSATIISRDKNTHVFDQINLSSYREQIKQMTTSTKGKLPYDIRLKSINDFIQSIIASVLSDDPYNWIICEGTSEKIYFTKYLEELAKDHKIRIIPVGGAKEIKRIYNHLAISYDDFKDEIKSKIILLSDTDAELVKYDVNTNFKNLICKRVVNCDSSRTTKLVHIQSNPVSPATEIETALNGLVFLNTLKYFSESYPDQLSFINQYPSAPEICSYYALDLRSSEWSKVQEFFDMDNNKFTFATKYVELLEDQHVVPEWIKEIISLIKQL